MTTVILFWESLATPWDPPGRAGETVQGEGSLGVPAQTAAPTTWPRISGKRWMDGWMDGVTGNRNSKLTRVLNDFVRTLPHRV